MPPTGKVVENSVSMSLLLQKTIGTSTITEKPPGQGGDKLPVAPFFNSVQGEEGGRQQRGMEDGARRSEADFPVFDAVPS